MSNLSTPPDEWLWQLFEFEWCAECGRDHRHHTAVPFMGNWFARCDREPQFAPQGGLVINPEGYVDESGLTHPFVTRTTDGRPQVQP